MGVACIDCEAMSTLPFGAIDDSFEGTIGDGLLSKKKVHPKKDGPIVAFGAQRHVERCFE